MNTFKDYKVTRELSEESDDFSKGVMNGAKLVSGAIVRTAKQKLLLASDQEKKIIDDFINSLAIEFKKINTQQMGLDPKKFAREASK